MPRPLARLAPIAYFFAAVLAAGAAHAQERASGDIAKGVAALEAILADPNAPIDPVLSTFDFDGSFEIVDELNGTQQRRLARLAHEYGIRFPSGIGTALRARGGRSSNNR